MISPNSEYQERYKRWSERAVDHFSFSNNLLLTISIAVLGYFFKEGKEAYKNISLWWPGSNSFNLEATLFSIATIFIAISVGFGLVVTLSRLYDFRLTRHIMLIRRRVYLDHVKVFPDKEPGEKTLISSFWDLIVILFTYRKKQICRSEYQIFDDKLKDKFLKIRSTTDGLGRLSWAAFNIQFLSFAIGFLIYIAYMFSVCIAKEAFEAYNHLLVGPRKIPRAPQQYVIAPRKARHIFRGASPRREVISNDSM